MTEDDNKIRSKDDVGIEPPRHALVLPLFAMMAPALQQRVFDSPPPGIDPNNASHIHALIQYMFRTSIDCCSD